MGRRAPRLGWGMSDRLMIPCPYRLRMPPIRRPQRRLDTAHIGGWTPPMPSIAPDDRKRLFVFGRFSLFSKW